MEPRQRRANCSFSPLQPAACGAGPSACPPSLRLSVTSTTGSPVELTVPRGETVEGLRTRISQRLRLRTDRIVLLHRDRHLTAGTLLEQRVTDGSRLTLVPVVEAGLVCSAARAEPNNMDVLESLSDAQINDFLSGCSPLTVSLRVGSHMMYVQLQLSAQDVKELRGGEDFRDSWPLKSPPDFPARTPDSHPSPVAAACLQRPWTPPTSVSAAVPTVDRPSSLPPPPSGAPHSVASSLSPLPNSPREAAAPLCSHGLSSSSPGPPSPAAASTFTAGNLNDPSSAELPQLPGAVIESFVSPSPGVFSGTFSGTLAPCSQSNVSHPRRGVSIILQILNDLLRAACSHQGAPPALSPHLHPAPSGPAASSRRAERLGDAPGQNLPPSVDCGGGEARSSEENRTLHCKLERLQHLLHQRRIRRRAGRKGPQASRPNRRRHHCP